MFIRFCTLCGCSQTPFSSELEPAKWKTWHCPRDPASSQVQQSLLYQGVVRTAPQQYKMHRVGRGPNDDKEEGDNLAEVKEAMNYITSHFRETSDTKGVTGIQDEIEEIVNYTRNFVLCKKSIYQKIWYKLQSPYSHHCKRKTQSGSSQPLMLHSNQPSSDSFCSCVLLLLQ